MLYVYVVSAATTGAVPKILTLFPSTDTLAALVNPNPAGDEEKVTSFAPPPRVNSIGVIAVS